MNTMQIYADANHPEQTMQTIGMLAACTDDLFKLLESYRYLQPDGQPFSAETIEKIARIQALQEEVAHHEQERDYHTKMIKRCEYEVDCIERGIEPEEEREDDIVF